ncbi:uncharacterized protein LOC113385000 [Ctenocephalides felis]|uniref:uncharacterized protein LOC113385000 n=1 Tax=Ctenocephalides felis TaxID=7515 RepID=UPI000E6E5813|nr:uncharacterized protein LOC113385000 [Ctenocephalides felis]
MMISILLFTFLSVFHLGSSLQCYQCDLANNPACTASLNSTKDIAAVECGKLPQQVSENDRSLIRFLPPNFDGHLSTTREGVGFQCAKIVATNNIQGGYNITRILRTCIVDTLNCEKINEDLKQEGFSSMMCATCNTNLCNSSTSLSITILLPFILFLITKATS